MSILSVGPGDTYITLAEAIAASAAGDTIQVQAGSYIDDFATVLHPLTIQGIGGLAHFIAASSPPNGKAILTVDADLTIDHLEFSGARVPDNNGAGIRYESGSLSISNSWFHDNQDGLLGAPSAGGSIRIDHSEFDHNGAGDGSTHNIYIGDIAAFTLTDSYLHDVDTGHEVKSRAQVTTITGNRIQDGPDLSASFSIDLPNGGQAVIADNVIEKGALAQNWIFVHFGGEPRPSDDDPNLLVTDPYPNSALRLSGNILVNDMQFADAPLALLNQSGVPAIFTDNTLYGLTPDQLADGPVAANGNRFADLADTPALDSAPLFALPEPASASLMLAMLAAAAIRRLSRRGRP